MMPEVPRALYEAIYQGCGAQLNNSGMRSPQAAAFADGGACQAPGRPSGFFAVARLAAYTF